MKLHVLGSSGGYPDANGGCPGYLIETWRKRILLDCGPGVLTPIQKICSLKDLDLIWISHLHTDHILDLFPLALGLINLTEYPNDDGTLEQIPVYVPRGMRQRLLAISSSLGHPEFKFPPMPEAGPLYEEFRIALSSKQDFFDTLLQISEYDLDGIMDQGRVRLTWRAVKHNLPASAIRVECDGISITYSGDTGRCEQLIDLAAGTNLLLCDAHNTSSGFHNDTHMSPYEAGQLASEAGVEQLALTHLKPSTDEAWAVQEAKRAFSGIIVTAQPSTVFDVKHMTRT